MADRCLRCGVLLGDKDGLDLCADCKPEPFFEDQEGAQERFDRAVLKDGGRR